MFVSEWLDLDAFRVNPDQFVPSALYLPDGRVVPTCVVLAREGAETPGRMPDYSFPRQFIGGGYPVLATVQGRERVASVGCLVTDGHTTYALTNRHATGDPPQEIYTVIGGARERIGLSDPRQLAKKAFTEVYDGWPGKHVYSHLDAGLIKVDDLSRWTTQVRGIGDVGSPIDLNTDTISLDLIDCPVEAYGAVSGPLFGSIAGFFYRYKAMGGFEYVSDLIIAPRGGSGTHPGDSGTLWCVRQRDADGSETFRPIALEWGGQILADDSSKRAGAHAFTLATSLSTILRELDLDLIRGWNVGLPYYWGAVGHYTIAAKACSFVSDPSLRRLMTANLENVSYPDQLIRKKTFAGLSKRPFVPLADVPDYVWKAKSSLGRGNSENPNHFADMDRVAKAGRFEGKTLLELCENSANIDVDVWAEYYDAVKDASRGTLPFRVWQIYDEMVRALEAKDLARYVCAAGVLAHYVGDACQPLHISFEFNGDPDNLVDGKKRGVGVHEAYEAQMLNLHAAELLSSLDDELPATRRPAAVSSGHEAAIAAVALMGETFELIKPSELVDAFVDKRDLWDEFGTSTVKAIANGVATLAMLWESAWKEGKSGSLVPAQPEAFEKEALAAIYTDPGFVPSHSLETIASVLGGAGADSATPSSPRSAGPKPPGGGTRRSSPKARKKKR